MATFRLHSTKVVWEYWCCDVEAESEEEAKNKYDFDEELFQWSEKRDFTVDYCEKIEFNKDEN